MIEGFEQLSEKQVAKLETAAQIEGYEGPFELLKASITDSLCPAICMNDHCDHIDNFEGDADGIICPLCKTPTVQSILVIAQII